MNGASDGAPNGAALAGVRVLECGGTLAGAYAGRLFADLGAEVITVQPPGGDATWHRGPSLDDDGPGVAGAYLHAGKRPAILVENDVDALSRLARASDVVIVDVDGGIADGDWARRLSTDQDDLIVVALSDFGLEGPLAGREGGDLVAQAISGMLSIVSTNPLEGPMRPIRYRTEMSDVFVASNGVLAAIGALYGRHRHGRGDLIDVSAIEALVGSSATALPAFTYEGVLVEPGGRRGVCPWAIYECRGGRFLMQITEDSQWRSLITLLGDPDWGHLEMFETNAGRLEQMESVESLVAAALAEVEMDDFLERAHAARVPVCRLHTPKEVFEWRQPRSRHFFRELTVLGHGTVEAPGTPLRLSDAPLGSEPSVVPPQVAPTIAEIAWRASGLQQRPTPREVGGLAPAPLDGVRVIDLTWVWAGPFAAMMLAHLGAEVVKVESMTRPDVTRVLGPYADGEPGLDRSGYFNQFNQGKKSVRFDPTTDAGREILASLISSADLVVDNMRPGALARMGFPIERLRELRPDIVAVSMTGFGSSGPEAGRQAYGSLIDALSGQVAATGVPGGGPTEVPMSLPDPCSGVHAAIAMVAALYRRSVHGMTATVDCAMVEAWIAGLADAVLYAAATGQDPPLVGNRDTRRVPHGVFSCAGEYEWIAIAVADDDQFRSLANVIGREDWADDPRFATVDGRRSNEDELEAAIERWTGTRTAREAESSLLAAGVCAARVRKFDEVAACAQLESRSYFTEFDHPSTGRRRLAGSPWVSGRTRVGPFDAAPTFGQHTTAILNSVGFDTVAIESLREAGVLH